MRFHYPSFLYYFEQYLPQDFSWFHHNGLIHLYTHNPYIRISALQELTAQVVERSLDEPLDAPRGPRERSLLDAPIDKHSEALKVALLVRKDYLQYQGKQPVQGGERSIYGYLIDLGQVQQILIEVRREEDVKLAMLLIEGEIFMSDRLLEKKILYTIGVAFSNRRIREITSELVKRNILKSNGRLRTHGREVMI